MRPAGVIDAARQAAPWVMAGVAVLAAGLCVYGAFVGTDRAAAMFRSPPLAALWVVLACLLLGGPLVHTKMLRRGGLLAAHLGAALVLIGAMAGSSVAHRLAGEWFGSTKTPFGVMVIPQGAATSTLLDGTSRQPVAALPFHVALGRFWIERHGADPAGPAKNYNSRLAILKDGRAVREATISVNRPLHYGGYHFYQDSYVPGEPACTVLAVVSDSGLSLVYAGLAILCGGLIWQMWARPAADYLRRRQQDGNQD